MVKRLAISAFFAVWSLCSSAQNDTSPADSTSATKAAPKEFIFKPTIGLGVGMLSYYGDIYDRHFQNPSVSRIAYELNVSQYLTNYLQFNFNVLFGRLGANERMTVNGRNLNFDSQIRAGGVNLAYNFDNFLSKKCLVHPYISAGFESFEFLSKTDLYDSQGNKYYYWSDGTIRSKAQNDPAAATAIELHRDYTYESDIRTLNYDGFGRYPERSWAVPVGVGFDMKINDYFNFRIGATMHFTFTDYIDGVSEKSTGNRIGNSKNDNFMMTSCSLHYNLGLKKKTADTISEDSFKDVDFYALDLQDFDKDGVPDYKDSCQGTPEGVPVDAKGCPMDDDGDGIPNNLDNEPNTPKGALVDTHGVQLNDSTLAYQYSFYTDSTGMYATVEHYVHNGGVGSHIVYPQKEYMVELGIFHKGLAPDVMTKFLSINDISSTMLDDSTTVYTAGKFNDLLSAENRRKELASQGLTDAKVVYKQNGKFIDAPKYGSAAAAGNGNGATPAGNNSGGGIATSGNPDKRTTPATNDGGNNGNAGNSHSNATNGNGGTAVTHPANTTSATSASGNESNGNAALNQQGVVLRVQLGAYHNRLSKSVFKDIGDLIEIHTDDGLYKYMTGSFTNFDDAAKHKVNMLLKGYSGAFIAAYKDGKRISLTEAGAIMPKKGEQPEPSENNSVNGADKALVIFKVQVGVFKSDPPADKQEIYTKVGGITKETTSSGLNRYVAGSFNNYKSAVALKNQLSQQGLGDAFVIAFFNGEYISVQEAIELSK